MSLLEPSSDPWLKAGVVLKPLGISVLVKRSGLCCTSASGGTFLLCREWESGLVFLQQRLGLFPPVLPSAASLPEGTGSPQWVRLGAQAAAAGRAQGGQSGGTPTQTKQSAQIPAMYSLQQLPRGEGEAAKRKSGRRGLSSAPGEALPSPGGSEEPGGGSACPGLTQGTG